MDTSLTTVSVVIADDHEIYRIGLRRVLESGGGFQVAGEAADGEQAICLTRQLKPDILLLDLAMPGRTGIDVLRELASLPLTARAIVLTAAIEPPQVVEALQFGARGVLLKNVGVAKLLIKCIHTVLRGQYWIGHEGVTDLIKALRQLVPQEFGSTQKRTFGLTARELEIVAKIVIGYTNKDIAQELSISEETVKRHLSNIFDKLGVSNRLELALYAVKNQIVGDQ